MRGEAAPSSRGAPLIFIVASAWLLRVHELVVGCEAAQRGDHALAAGERGAAVVGPELALPREPAR